MKEQLAAVVIASILLLSITGCSAANARQMLDAAEERVEAMPDVAEDKLEDSLRKTVSPAPSTASAQTMPAAAENSGMLTREQAQQIALEYLGFTADQIDRLRIEYEVDDGVPQFDVAFHQGDWEYEFEIHAENGKILSYDRDHKYD